VVNNRISVTDPSGMEPEWRTGMEAFNSYLTESDGPKPKSKPIQLQEVQITATRMLGAAATIFSGVALRTGAQWGLFWRRSGALYKSRTRNCYYALYRVRFI